MTSAGSAFRHVLLAALAALAVGVVGAVPASPSETVECHENRVVSASRVAYSCGLSLVGSLDVTDTGTGQIAVHDDLAAVVRRDDGIVTLVDLTDHTAPVALGSYDGGTGNAALDHPLDGDVAFSHDGQYLFHARQTSDYSNEGLHVLRVADPSNPVRTDYAAQGGMLRVDTAVIDGREVVVTLDAIHGLTVFAVVRTPASAHVVPLHVDPLPALKVGGPASGGLEIVAEDPVFGGATLYVADGTTGLRVVDLTNPAAPVELAAWDEAGLAAIAVDHREDHVVVHAAAEYWFQPATPPWLHTLRIDADGGVTEIDRRAWGISTGPEWKLGGMELVDGELFLAHAHSGMLGIDPATNEVRRATTDLGEPGEPRSDLGGVGWYAMDVTTAGAHLLVSDAVTGELRIFARR